MDSEPEALATLINGALVNAALWIAHAPRAEQSARLDRALAMATTLLEGLRRG